MSRLPDLEGKQPGPNILKRPDGRTSLASVLSEIVAINLQRRTVGIFVRKSWNLGFPQNRGCYEPSARLLEAGTKVEMKSDMVGFLHYFHLWIDSQLTGMVCFFRVWSGPVVIRIAARLQRQFTRVINPQPESGVLEFVVRHLVCTGG